jgi:hypothetical protein
VVNRADMPSLQIGLSGPVAAGDDLGTTREGGTTRNRPPGRLGGEERSR